MSQTNLKTVSLRNASQWGFNPEVISNADRFEDVNPATLRILVHDIATANVARDSNKREKWVTAAIKVFSPLFIDERRAGLRDVILAMGTGEKALNFQRSNPETAPALREFGGQLARFIGF